MKLKKSVNTEGQYAIAYAIEKGMKAAESKTQKVLFLNAFIGKISTLPPHFNPTTVGILYSAATQDAQYSEKVRLSLGKKFGAKFNKTKNVVVVHHVEDKTAQA